MLPRAASRHYCQPSSICCFSEGLKPAGLVPKPNLKPTPSTRSISHLGSNGLVSTQRKPNEQSNGFGSSDSVSLASFGRPLNRRPAKRTHSLKLSGHRSFHSTSINKAPAKKDPYEVLGVNKGSSAGDIKKAYYQVSSQRGQLSEESAPELTECRPTLST
jgi:hypothetical protein